MKAPEIARHLGISAEEYDKFSALLAEMRSSGEVVQIKRKQYAVPGKVGLAVGKMECNPAGFGFVRLFTPGEADVYVSQEDMNGAMHGDVVVLHIDKPARRHRRGRWQNKGPYGRVVDVVCRASSTVTGTLASDRGIWHVVPDNPKLPKDIYVAEEYLYDAKPGQRVVVKINQWPTAHLAPAGEIVEVLGDAGDPAIDAISIIKEYSLRESFPSAVLAEARELSDAIRLEEISRRRDLRTELLVTIDPIDAADFDDAVSLVQLENGWRLGVHIADVSHYAKPESEIDREARLRGTSVYLPGHVLPMLPEKLSKEVCSLRAGEVRLAKTIRITFSLDGEPRRSEIFLSVVQPKMQLTYRRVLELLNGAAGTEPGEVREMLREMAELSVILRERRCARGSLDFDLPEVELHVNEDGSIREIEQVERNPARSLIEEFMLCANEAVARYMTRHKLPYLRRVHMEPSVEDMQDFQRFADAMGFFLKDPLNVHELQSLLDKCRGKGYAYPMNLALLCAMKQAEYSPRSSRHYALATQKYTHFTSPIRRYPDLFLHQVLGAHLYGELTPESRRRFQEELAPLASVCTEAERKAEEAERDLTNIKLMRLLQQHAHQRLPAHIVGFSSSAMLVRLDDLLVEGTVKFSSMIDDFYALKQSGTQLVGRYNRKRYKIGDAILVQPSDVNIPARKLFFSIVGKA